MLAGLLLAPPVASAFSVGVDTGRVSELKSAGGVAKYGQTWVGTWTKSNWGAYENSLRDAKNQGTTPVVLWYYWGDAISPNAVKYGSSGRSKGEWDWMAKELATRGKNVMGSQPFLVVLEPEFNKQGIASWEDFDGMLANQASIIKAHAPNAKIVIGFGYWGGWDKFDRAVAKADYVGFQLMRASTRDSSSQGTGMADQAVEVSGKLKARWHKPIILFDLAISSYGGWEWVQEKAIQNFAAKRGQLDDNGVFGVVYRYVRDNCLSKGYFGAAECHWGLKRSDGGHKAAWNDWVALSKGGSGSLPSGGGSPSSGGAFTADFTNVKVTEWWVQTTVKASKSLSMVEASINGGSWQRLDNLGWGHAKSLHVNAGESVQFRAKATDGSTTYSGKYGRDGGTPAPAPSGGGKFSADFTNVKVSDWWVQTTVKATKAISKVEARVDGGSWQRLDNVGWGHAKSLRVGSSVEFKATATDGSTTYSAKYWKSGGSTSSPAPSSGKFDAQYSNVKTDEWWVQTSVKANQGVSKVEVRVNGGSWTTLDKQSWGAYAKSVNVKAGNYVEFRATSTGGAQDYSAKYWR